MEFICLRLRILSAVSLLITTPNSISKSQTVLISKTLKEYEELLSDQGFERIHQSHLINLNELKSYIKKDGGFVIMSDNTQVPVFKGKRIIGSYLKVVI
jgi:hypothetical protein